MRAAGCVMNDIADRRIDLHVKRTKNRPLTSGEISLQGAAAFLLLLLLAALVILLQLPLLCFYFALLALAVTILYPFCKRFLECPQLVLGIAFSLGIPMAFAAVGDLSNPAMLYLLLINIAWIVAYDTQYAMADRADDLRIGVKSSAILFASYDRLIITSLQIFFHALWLVLAWISEWSSYFYIGWIIGLFILIYQQKLLGTRIEANYSRAFASNAWYGVIMWIAVCS